MLVQNYPFLYRSTPQRLETLEVKVGNLALGSAHPVRLQSMTSVNTLDTEAVVAQSIRMIEAGCELVRITAPGIREAEHLAVIKKELKIRGFDIPLVADIHYNPEAALVAARLVEKVRINPGNYIDRRATQTQFTQNHYDAALEQMALRMAPLLAVCKQYGTALRIGSNHGSLSERIVNRYGDTPLGMTEAALEFVDICESYGFNNLVLSMKSSNTRVMVQATRLLAARLVKRGRVYPLHLGVTEAGEGEDGRVRSAAGIGALLADGIGDTIRVSLTEEPENELPVARELQKIFAATSKPSGATEENVDPPVIDPFAFHRYLSREWEGLGGGKPVLVIGGDGADMHPGNKMPQQIMAPSGKALPLLHNPATEKQTSDHALVLEPGKAATATTQTRACIISLNDVAQLPAVRLAITRWREQPEAPPVVISHNSSIADSDRFATGASALLGSLLIDGLADGIWLQNSSLEQSAVVATAFNLLQATRLRFTRPEYISCPSCGRTLFNIQKAVQQVRKATSHLTGLTIGVMGCIVNGPGEMAGADYGVVGAGKGKVTLFKGDVVARQSVNEEEAADALVDLIKKNGDWRDPASNV